MIEMNEDGKTVHEILKKAIGSLRAAGVENAAFEAREIVGWIMDLTPTQLASEGHFSLSPLQQLLCREQVQARCARRPLAHVLGEWDFRNVRLRLTGDVLVPRPETEELVEVILRYAVPRPFRLLADVGTGSGCLAVALADAMPHSMVWAMDLSPEALRVARSNAAKNRVIHRMVFREGDLLEPYLRTGAGGLDAVVANLPYVARGEFSGLSPEVLQEPRLALDGGVDGMDLIRRLIPQAAVALEPEGMLFLEVGHTQASRIVDVLSQSQWRDIKIERDFSHQERFVVATKPKRVIRVDK